ncbi:ImmA/IrrE family metallo-endopeptidase [Ruminiclostridium cellobioparum]|uniref:ImmA/IrrE family metallo-endopeptidase n=1 Tax=Ruminiclostridium cellobioparum TaxID=29355 RepID=UPI0028AF57F9|nr:hypothetical protein [Ruminiclostridium cellobioparum]
MSEIITSENLEQLIGLNRTIKDEVASMIDNLNVRYNTSGITNKENLAFKILKDNHLIQIPVEDEYWGGAVFAKDDFKIPIINTAQPRVYQYFVAWHEVYHLVYDSNLPGEMHNITVDMKMNERKADYFAASVLLGNVYEYYYTLEDEDFVNRIIRCMDLYKAPYKAVLIHLFEKAVTLYNDLQLKELILEHFDHKPDDMVKRFELLELDPELVKPTNLVSLGGLDKLLMKNAKEYPETTYHESNYKFLMQLKDRILKLAGRV